MKKPLGHHPGVASVKAERLLSEGMFAHLNRPHDQIAVAVGLRAGDGQGDHQIIEDGLRVGNERRVRQFACPLLTTFRLVVVNKINGQRQ